MSLAKHDDDTISGGGMRVGSGPQTFVDERQPVAYAQAEMTDTGVRADGSKASGHGRQQHVGAVRGLFVGGGIGSTAGGIKIDRAVLLAKSVGMSDWVQVLAGLAALAGHIWPVWLGWKGGKAVATGLGMFLGLAWPVGLACFGLFMAVISIFRIVSLSSVVAAIGLPVLMLLSGSSSAYVVVSLVASLMVLWRHRSNIQRLIAGTEPKIGQKQQA